MDLALGNIMKRSAPPIIVVARVACAAAACVACAALPALAQADAAPPCEGLPPAPGGAAPDVEPFFGLFLESPPGGGVVPRNVEIRLGGEVSGLDVDPPIFTVELRDLAGGRVPLDRDGAVFRPREPLPARESFLLIVEPTPAHPCPDCSTRAEIALITNDEIDVTAPQLDAAPPVDVFVLPPAEQAAQCGLFFGTTHQVVVSFGAELPLQTWIDVAARKEGEAPVFLARSFNSGAVFPLSGDVGSQVPVALGDSFYVSVTPRDLAGNTGVARTVRVRARSFTDQSMPAEERAPLWCDMPAEPTIVAPALLPTNGQLVVEFPFEEVPLALVPAGVPPEPATTIPLVPLTDTPLGHVYGTATELPADTSFDVVGLRCPHCVCEGCARFPPRRITTGAGPDTTPPAAPVMRELLEDSAPAVSAAEECRPDRPALVVVLEPGQDDVAAPLELRYDASIRLGESPPRVLASGASPLLRSDGSTVLRLETRDLGRVLGERFELTLAAVDNAGHRAESTTTHEPDTGAGGCASTASAPFGIALCSLMVFARRRRR